MGLIMLILIGTVPTAYALNRALPESQVAQFQKTSDAASKVISPSPRSYGEGQLPCTFSTRRHARLVPGIHVLCTAW
ncbi:protein of unknown function [Bradyrhizobium vignae]|uniref:Uncharacterized protein n=1 Tax=Bradyrhizobium vignae TaxID=1549949 RepID=A0A2U3Q5C3_9BRAD|nr:protein of unknown function [Bradyrhizobium vignae]